MARRRQRSEDSNAPEEAVSTSKPTIKERVTVVLIKGNGLTHPCGTRLLPNDPTDLPFDNWTRAQEAAGLLNIQ